MAVPTSGQFKKKTLREVALGFNNGATPTPAVAYIPLNSAGVTPSPETQELITQGTTQRYRDREISSYTITVDQQVVEDALLQLAHEVTTTGLPSGVAKRYHGSGVLESDPVELRLKYTMINIADRSVRTEYWRFLLGTLNSADPPTSPAQQVVGSQYVFSFEKTTVDVAGGDVEGVGDEGDFYVVEVMS